MPIVCSSMERLLRSSLFPAAGWVKAADHPLVRVFQYPDCRPPCKLTRAFSPRKSMKIVFEPSNNPEGRGDGEIEKTVEMLTPNVSLIRSVRDRANKWCVVSSFLGTAIARDPG